MIIKNYNKNGEEIFPEKMVIKNQTVYDLICKHYNILTKKQ